MKPGGIWRDVRLTLQAIFEWSGTDFVNDVLLKNVSYIFDRIVCFLYVNTFS